MSIAISLHMLAVVVWVGGMFFAYMALRPVAAEQLEPPARLSLWRGVFGRFFPWVWVAVALLVLTGFWMISAVLGGFDAIRWHVWAMLWLAVVMMAIFMHVFFAPYKRLRRAVESQDWPAGGKQLAQIRVLVGINTLIGLATIIIGAGGRYL